MIGTVIDETNIEILKGIIGRYRPHHRTLVPRVLHIVQQEENLRDTAAEIYTQVARSLGDNDKATQTAKRLGILLIHRAKLTETIATRQCLTLGIMALDWMAKAKFVEMQKYSLVDGPRGDTWFVSSISQDLTDYATHLLTEPNIISPTRGPIEWTEPSMRIGGRRVDIVKKARMLDRLDDYTYDKMPSVYNALNRLNRQTFTINASLLDLVPSSPFQPKEVADEDRRAALRELNDIKRKAKYLAEVRFKELHKWMEDETDMDDATKTSVSQRKASEFSQDYEDVKAEPHLAVISNWSKHIDFHKILHLAEQWREGDINYLLTMDSRGRIYTVQNYLTPLGQDIAKALLTFKEEQQVSGFDLCVHIANCFGRDKLSFPDRVQWVNDNSGDLYLIGENPWDNYRVIERLGLDKEQKTRWQGIAACIEYCRYVDHVQSEGTEEGFLSNLIIGLDSSASGTQLLSILGRDDKVAPYVNISATKDGKVGDFYTYLSDFLKPKLEEKRGTSPTLDNFLDVWPKVARTTAKRNSMTFPYSATKSGFGSQHWEDRTTYGKEGAALTRQDCRLLGDEMYAVCSENIRGGAEIMQWLRDGIDYRKDGSVISWTLPDGFKAFQAYDIMKKLSVEGFIGDQSIRLVFYKNQDKMKRKAHKNAISPNFIHSYDALLLRTIVNTLPVGIPISTVHDQFSTTSLHIEELQYTAKEAYKTIACRTTAEKICEEAFGIHRQLPEVGHWTVDQIDGAEFIIC